jgi:hypothetical protein
MAKKRATVPVADSTGTSPTTIADLIADPQNRRTHPARNIRMVVDALEQVGAARSIVIDELGVVLAGNGVTAAAAQAGISKLRVVDVDGDELVAVRRRGLTEDQKRTLALFDNRTGELAEWDIPALLSDRDAGFDLRPFWTPEEEAELASRAAAGIITEMGVGGAPEADTPGLGLDYQTFSCALTVDQERVVRAALRTARAKFQVDTTGNALTAALQAWSETIGPTDE